MTTRAERASGFETDREPAPDEPVQLLCEDHVGTYVIPFACRRRDDGWMNDRTGDVVEANVIGWRAWPPPGLRGHRAGS